MSPHVNLNGATRAEAVISQFYHAVIIQVTKDICTRWISWTVKMAFAGLNLVDEGPPSV